MIQINEDPGAAPPRFRDEGLDYAFVHGQAFRSAKLTDAAGKVVDVVAGAF